MVEKTLSKNVSVLKQFFNHSKIQYQKFILMHKNELLKENYCEFFVLSDLL